MRRVVVTGLGMVTPLGCGVEPTWKRILNSESGARKIDTFDVSDLTSRIACVIPRGDGTDGTFNPDQWMEPKDQRKVDDFIIFAMCAARQALDDANWHPSTEEERCATGTMIGSGIGGLSGIADTALLLKERGPRKVSPFFIPGRLINLASGYVSIEHGLKGPNHSVVTACSTGAHAIGDASRLIALGDADVMVAGGTESPICRLSMAGFCAVARAVDRLQRDAGKGLASLRQGSRRLRDGRRRRHRGARGIRARQEARREDLCRGDRLRPVRRRLSHHLAVAGRRWRLPQHERGDEARRNHRCPTSTTSMRTAPRRQVGDEIELGAVERLLGNAASKVSMSSTKSSTGHLLGAAGAIETIFSILAIRDNVAPPTINLDNPSVETAIDLVPQTRAQARDQCRAVEFVRFRGHQRIRDRAARDQLAVIGTTPPFCRIRR